jgi:hypothetical protein
MSDNGKKNGIGNYSETKPKLFEKGGPGGPGRAKSAEIDDSEARIKKVKRAVDQLLGSKELRERAKGVELYMKFRLFLDPQTSVIENPQVMDALRWYVEIPKLGSAEDFWKFCRRCLDCEHFPFDREKTKQWILIEDIDFNQP